MARRARASDLKKVATEIESAIECLIETRRLSTTPRETDLDSMFRSLRRLPGWKGGGNYINAQGAKHFDLAAKLLVQAHHLQRRLTVDRARTAIVTACQSHLESAKTTQLFKTEQAIEDALTEASKHLSADGSFVFPAVFASGSKTSEFRMGPVRIVPRALFESEHAEEIGCGNGESPLHAYPELRKDWRDYTANYDHVVAVELSGYEEQLGWEAAREVAEFALNVVRMCMGYRSTSDIRIAGGLAHERLRSAMRIDPRGKVLFRTTISWPGASFDDGWLEKFDEAASPFQDLCASFADWLASGADPEDLILNRLRYANQLIAEAYSEPHEHIRIVRLISAFEALAVLPGADKAHELAYRCACAGGWCDPRRAVEIYDAIREAYPLRSAIVHGDGIESIAATKSFFRVEAHSWPIVLGFLDLFAKIRAEKRTFQSIGALRHAVAENIGPYFWGLLTKSNERFNA